MVFFCSIPDSVIVALWWQQGPCWLPPLTSTAVPFFPKYIILSTFFFWFWRRLWVYFSFSRGEIESVQIVVGQIVDTVLRGR